VFSGELDKKYDRYILTRVLRGLGLELP